VVVAGAAGNAGRGAGAVLGLPKLGPCQTAARTSRATSSAAMTARPNVLPDGRWSARQGCGRSLMCMCLYYPTGRIQRYTRSRPHLRTGSSSRAGDSAEAVPRAGTNGSQLPHGPVTLGRNTSSRSTARSPSSQAFLRPWGALGAWVSAGGRRHHLGRRPPTAGRRDDAPSVASTCSSTTLARK
jgi:hypothetical protein